MEQNNCINCQSELSGEYCYQCGQRAGVYRITFKTLFQEYIGRLFGLDTKFLRTARDLTINPGLVGRSFIGGNRVKYMGPVAYFFIITTLMIFLITALNVDIKEFFFSDAAEASQSMSQQPATDKQLAFQQKVFQMMSDNMRMFGFLVIPFIGLAGKWIYRSAGYNWLEHMVNAFYIQGQTTIVTILAVIVFWVSGYNFNMYAIAILIPYFTWASLRFYQLRGFGQVIKGILFYLLSNILFIITFMIVGGLTIFVYAKYINPEFLR